MERPAHARTPKPTRDAQRSFPQSGGCRWRREGHKRGRGGGLTQGQGRRVGESRQGWCEGQGLEKRQRRHPRSRRQRRGHRRFCRQTQDRRRGAHHETGLLPDSSRKPRPNHAAFNRGVVFTTHRDLQHAGAVLRRAHDGCDFVNAAKQKSGCDCDGQRGALRLASSGPDRRRFSSRQVVPFQHRVVQSRGAPAEPAVHQHPRAGGCFFRRRHVGVANFATHCGHRVAEKRRHAEPLHGVARRRHGNHRPGVHVQHELQTHARGGWRVSAAHRGGDVAGKKASGAFAFNANRAGGSHGGGGGQHGRDPDGKGVRKRGR
mmetsp:Transcript_11869/g.44160  ORF Transcript_11869/g.44160 Transcript_11869/m.44160 type:complete len:318 (-) Transcript_11869:6647-7600(-)